jgi:beta-galactosidase
MVEVKQRRILIDGKPRIILAGELHYFRLARKDWRDRIRKAIDAGCNAIAAYSPWLIHEPQEGQFDFEGPGGQYDLAEFIDLVHAHKLWFIARPGPFVMAEMKNEGIPYWVYDKHPDAVPITWDGERARSHTLDFMNPGFLETSRRWYARIMPIFAERLQQNGGPVIGCQLDNEIGMLSWVNNQPELTEVSLCAFSEWIIARYGAEAAVDRYPFDLYDPAERAVHLRSPGEGYGAAFHRDWGDFARTRTARYIAALRGFAEENGVKDIPFIVNIHGTGGGRLYGLPIGISQLYESYTQAEGYLSGSDHYFDGFSRETGPDLYLMHTMMEAVHRPEQPSTSMEFSVGSQDYGETGGQRDDSASAEMKILMSLAQGCRLLNYYLLSGGRNPMMAEAEGDGNGRIATTGERHGFAAPINPEGGLDPTYFGIQRASRVILPLADKLADMDEERDPIALGFVPDWWKADYRYGEAMTGLVRELEDMREPLARLTRSMLFLGFRFGGLDIQHQPIDAPALAIASPELMDEHIQQKLADWVRGGGRLLIMGAFPNRDMEGRPCTVLADALGLRLAETRRNEHGYHLSTQGAGILDFEPEVRVWRAGGFLPTSEGQPILRFADTGAPCAMAVQAGSGRCVAVPTVYPWHKAAYEAIFDWLGVRPGLTSDCSYDGVMHTTMRNARGERVLVVCNLDAEEKVITLRERGETLLGPFTLASRGVILREI